MGPNGVSVAMDSDKIIYRKTTCPLHISDFLLDMRTNIYTVYVVNVEDTLVDIWYLENRWVIICCIGKRPSVVQIGRKVGVFIPNP